MFVGIAGPVADPDPDATGEVDADDSAFADDDAATVGLGLESFFALGALAWAAARAAAAASFVPKSSVKSVSTEVLTSAALAHLENTR
jgi:hypothetical protein